MKKTVLITGSSRGIGRSIAWTFAKSNYNVVINYVKNEKKALELKNDLVKNFKTDVLVIKADVKKEEEVRHMFKEIINKFGSIDLVINNAGIAIDTTLEDKTVENFKKTLDINLIGPFIVSMEAIKYMDKGSIINIASTNGIDTYYPYSLDYDASKAGLISLTHNLAYALSPNIRVNAIAPGWIKTDMNANLDKQFIEEECKKIYLKRFGLPEEVAKVAFFLASEDASYINGEVIRVDGGSNHA